MTEVTRGLVRRCGVWCALALAAVVSASNAYAAPVEFSGGEVRSSRGTWKSEIELGVPGKMMVQVWDLGEAGTIFAPLDSLSFSITRESDAGIVGGRLGEGLLMVDITQAGRYFLNISMTPSTLLPFQMGVVSWRATFDSEVAPVPLPMSVWLMLAGLAWAMGLQRKRAMVFA